MWRVARVEEVSPRNTSPILVVEAIIRIVASSYNIPVFIARTFWSSSSMNVGTAFFMGQRTILQSPERAVVDQRSFTTKSQEHVTRLLSRVRRQRGGNQRNVLKTRGLLTSRVLGTQEENARYEVQGARHGRTMYKERECRWNI